MEQTASGPGCGAAMERVDYKLKYVKAALRDWASLETDGGEDAAITRADILNAIKFNLNREDRTSLAWVMALGELAFTLNLCSPKRFAVLANRVFIVLNVEGTG